MAKFLILGGGGRLAKAILAGLPSGHGVAVCSKSACDITVASDVQSSIHNIKPDIVINCAGTLPPTTEHNPDLARDVNTLGAVHVAVACRDARVRLVHISTDAVFDGNSFTFDGYSIAGRKETDETGTPVNEYGFTKKMAETVLKNIFPSSLILRAPFRHRGPWPHTHAFTDAYRSSQWVDEVVPDIIQAALIPDLCGVLHMGGVRRSVFDMAREASPDVQPCLLEDFKEFRVPRDLTLDSSKWARIKRERGL